MGSYDDGRKSLENTHMLICSGRHTLWWTLLLVFCCCCCFFFFLQSCIGQGLPDCSCAFWCFESCKPRQDWGTSPWSEFQNRDTLDTCVFFKGFMCSGWWDLTPHFLVDLHPLTPFILHSNSACVGIGSCISICVCVPHACHCGRWCLCTWAGLSVSIWDVRRSLQQQQTWMKRRNAMFHTMSCHWMLLVPPRPLCSLMRWGFSPKESDREMEICEHPVQYWVVWMLLQWRMMANVRMLVLC